MADELMLGADSSKYLEVEIQGVKKTFHVPLSNSLNLCDAMILRNASKAPEDEREDAFFDAFYRLICNYIPKEYVDHMSVSDFTRLSSVWNDVSEEDASPGESQPSPSS